MPEISGGKMRRVMVMNTSELSAMFWSKPRNTRPTAPAATENMTISMVQVMPILALFLSSFSLRSDMKRMMMCGMPK